MSGINRPYSASSVKDRIQRHTTPPAKPSTPPTTTISAPTSNSNANTNNSRGVIIQTDKRPASANYRIYKPSTHKVPDLIPALNSQILNEKTSSLQHSNSATQLQSKELTNAQKQVLHFKNFTFNPNAATINTDLLKSLKGATPIVAPTQFPLTQQQSSSKLSVGGTAPPTAAKIIKTPSQMTINTTKGAQAWSEEKQRSPQASTPEGVRPVQDSILSSARPAHDNVFVFVRRADEKRENPERLNLDRRNLNNCPILEGEEKLKLLNFQYNNITYIDNMMNLPNLIFLDLYNNKIKKISNLEYVPTLRVLMLGKNQISKIENLECLSKLDVLDLHSNNIEVIEGLSHLKGLRVLNLAGNKISTVENVSTLTSLTEINLRRNRIELVKELDQIPNLQRVFLSNNAISVFDHIQCLFSMKMLMELSLDGNPISAFSFYRQHLLEKIKSLRHLDLKRITEEERRICAAIMKKEEEKSKKESKKKEKKETIFMIRKFWQDIISKKPSSKKSLIGNVSAEQEDDKSKSPMHQISVRAFMDVEGSTMHVYGDADILSERYCLVIESITFQYLSFDRVCNLYMAKLKKFVNLTSIELRDNNLTNLSEIAKLKVLPNILSFSIYNSPICIKNPYLLKPFCIATFNKLKSFNGHEVTEQDRFYANQIFERRNVVVRKQKASPGYQPALSAVVNSSATSAAKIQETASKYIESVVNHSFTIDSKMKAIDEEWDSVITQIVYSTLQQLDNAELFESTIISDLESLSAQL